MSRRVELLCLVLTLLGTSASLAQEPVRWASADTAGFLRLRPRRLLEDPGMQAVVPLYRKVEKEAQKVLRGHLGFVLEEIEEVAFLFPGGGRLTSLFPDGDPLCRSAVAVVRLNRDVDAAAAPKTFARGKPLTRKAGNRTVWIDQETWLAICATGPHELMVGSEDSVLRTLAPTASDSEPNPLDAFQKLAAGPEALAFGANLISLRGTGWESILPPKAAGLAKARSVGGTFDFQQGETRLKLSMLFASEEKAKDGLGGARSLISLGLDQLKQQEKEMEEALSEPNAALDKQMASLCGLAFLRYWSEFLAALPLRQAGNQLLLDAQIPQQAISGWTGTATLSLTAISFIGTRSVATFRQVGVALGEENPGQPTPHPHLEKLYSAIEKYREEKGHYPPASIDGPGGEPLLGWPVALLPYLGEKELYQQFKLDEPWHSPHNKPLLSRVPEVFRSETSFTGKPHLTSIRLVAGPGTLFEAGKKLGKDDIADGANQTVLLIEAEFDDTRAVPWTKPAAIPSEGEGLQLRLFGSFSDGIHALFADGKVRRISRHRFEEQELPGLFLRADGKKLDLGGKPPR